MFLRPMALANWEIVIMATLYPHIVVQRNTTIGGLPDAMLVGYETLMKTESHPYEQIGLRLQRVRMAFSDLNQKSWAEKHGFEPTQWNNWEKGHRRIPVENAERLCEVYGLTLDFLYRGRRDGLSETASKAL